MYFIVPSHRPANICPTFSCNQNQLTLVTSAYIWPNSWNPSLNLQTLDLNPLTHNLNVQDINLNLLIFQVGTLDQLVGLSDDLGKLDGFVENVTRKVAQYLGEVRPYFELTIKWKIEIV